VGGREGGREEKAEKMKCVGVARKPGFVKRAKEQTNQVCKEYEEKDEGGGGEERESARAREREKHSKSGAEREERGERGATREERGERGLISYKIRRIF
jgi:hypothetical protein